MHPTLLRVDSLTRVPIIDYVEVHSWGKEDWCKKSHSRAGREYNMAVFGICQFLNGMSVIWIKDGRYLVFQSPSDDGKIQFLIENTTVTVFIQQFYDGITLIFEKNKR